MSGIVKLCCLLSLLFSCQVTVAQQSAPPQLETPQIVRRPLTITGRVTHDNGRGVIVAQGGREHGFAVHMQRGKLVFDVRVDRTVTRLISPLPVPPKFSFTATLTPDEMQLHIDNRQVGRKPSPGLIPVQPGDGLDVGKDELSAAGDYRSPNPFNGAIDEIAVTPGKEVRNLRPFVSQLITPWGESVTAENAWQEYPRPLLQRDQWACLNGHWDYAITEADVTAPPADWTGKILVPFSIESRLSGVQRLLNDEEALWYRRWITTDHNDHQRVLLNFEAVDYQCEIYINRKLVGTHTGGNTPFQIDITSAMQSGQNELIVRVEDDTEAWQLRGKQVRNPRGIWYTQVSGIWQTVWMETVPAATINDLLISTSATSGEIHVTPRLQQPGTVRVTAMLNGTPVAAGTGTGRISLKVPDAQLWSPQNPVLYDLSVELLAADGSVADTVRSYAGIRDIGRIRDKDGHWRFTLNGRIVFHWGPLDQGWWPDGLLTPPSDSAMLFDIEWLRSAGFNMIRKHIKVEPRRYYYHCDRLGMLVWQDHVSGAEQSTWPEWSRLAPDPVDSEWPAQQHEQFMLELDRMISTLESHPCIACWVPLNERWGQHQTMEIGRWTAQRDPGRLVNIASGGNFFPVGHIVDAHKYPHPEFPFAQGTGGRFDDYIKVMGEFGGHGLPTEGHLWDESRRNWGYGDLPKDISEYRQRYETSLQMLNELRSQGIAAGVYTQTTDVEGEINGLLTYDRRVIKIPAATLAELHQQLFTE